MWVSFSSGVDSKGINCLEGIPIKCVYWVSMLCVVCGYVFTIGVYPYPYYTYLSIAYVTGFEKTLRIGFFMKIKFDVWLISSTIELTHVQILGRSRASLWRYSALFAIAPHPQ